MNIQIRSRVVLYIVLFNQFSLINIKILRGEGKRRRGFNSSKRNENATRREDYRNSGFDNTEI